ncbi:MAG: nitrite/sulfite reductase [Gammaproteobacteria bacterium]|nr:nitrite/sulfite reductase [Gammaproteobacteria bacterium]
MYQPDSPEKEFYQSRADQFANQVTRYLDGILDADVFQQLRLRNGLYVERYSPMIRVAIPYGQMSSAQLRALADIADRYDRGYGHFTTRQNIQFNWVTIEDSPDLLRDLAEVGMHAIQTSGSCVRNITTDHLAGLSPDEMVDPRPWCELIRQWSTLHPEFYWLPRKFKIAVSGAIEDRAAVRFHDIGIDLYRGPSNQTLARILVGGGMGRTPVVGKVLKESQPAENLLAWLQAIIHVYNKHGRRDNKYKARIKILVNNRGIDRFREEVESVYEKYSELQGEWDERRFIDIENSFARPELGDHAIPDNIIPVHSDGFLKWIQVNTEAHTDPDRAIVQLPLKSKGAAPGDMDSESMRNLADIADYYSGGEIRVTHRQNLVLPWVQKKRLHAVWHHLNEIRLATPNLGMLTDSIVCPGLDYCSLANASTIPVIKELGDAIDDLDRIHDIGKISLKMSGCMNACGHHHAADIGILGVDKKGKEWYQITLGGNAGKRARIGERVGPAISRQQIVAAILNILDTYLDIRESGESFGECVRRTGLKPYQENLYADHKKSRNHTDSVAA